MLAMQHATQHIWIASGQGIENGADLKATGYENIELDGNIGYGNAPLEFTADNIDDYNF